MKQRVSILIVDDDENFAEGTKDILTEQGYACEIVNNGAKAVEMLKKNGFKVILSDIKMPVMNGVEMVKEMMKDKPDVIVIMMTAFREEDLIQEALKEGAYGVLHKPLDFERLKSLIERSQKGGAMIEVVDDDPNTRETLKDTLEAKGFVVTTVATGEEAVEVARQKPQDILIVDLKLPRMNGLEVFLRIKEINPKAKAIVITAHYTEMEKEIEAALSKGAYALIRKPFETEKLILIIEKIIANKKSGGR